MRKLLEGMQPGGGELACTVFTVEEVQARVYELGREIGKAYTAQDHLLVLGLLQGVIHLYGRSSPVHPSVSSGRFSDCLQLRRGQGV